MPARDPLLAPISERIRPLPDLPGGEGFLEPGHRGISPADLPLSMRPRPAIVNPLVPGYARQRGKLVPASPREALEGVKEAGYFATQDFLNMGGSFAGFMPGPGLRQTAMGIAQMAFDRFGYKPPVLEFQRQLPPPTRARSTRPTQPRKFR